MKQLLVAWGRRTPEQVGIKSEHPGPSGVFLCSFKKFSRQPLFSRGGCGRFRRSRRRRPVGRRHWQWPCESCSALLAEGFVRIMSMLRGSAGFLPLRIASARGLFDHCSFGARVFGSETLPGLQVIWAGYAEHQEEADDRHMQPSPLQAASLLSWWLLGSSRFWSS